MKISHHFIVLAAVAFLPFGSIHAETIVGNYQRTNVISISDGEAVVIDTAVVPYDAAGPRSWWQGTNQTPVRIAIDRDQQASANYRFLSQDPQVLAGPGRLFISGIHAITFHRVRTTNLITAILKSNEIDPVWISIADNQRIFFVSAFGQASYFTPWDVGFLPAGTRAQWDRIPILDRQKLKQTNTVTVDLGARSRVFDGPYDLALFDSTYKETTRIVVTYAVIDNPRFEEPFPVADLQQNYRAIIVERSEDLEHWGVHSLIRPGSDPRQTFRLRIAN